METSQETEPAEDQDDAEAVENARRLVIGTSVARAERCLLTAEKEAAAKHPNRPDLQESFTLGMFRTALEHLVAEMKPFGASSEEVEQFWAPLRGK